MSTAVIRKKWWNYKTVIHIFFILFSLTFIVPLLFVISASFTNEDALMEGYRLIPLKFDTTAYGYALEDTNQLISSYLVTFLKLLWARFCRPWSWRCAPTRCHGRISGRARS